MDWRRFGIPGEIRNWHRPNTSQKNYLLSHLFVNLFSILPLLLALPFLWLHLSICTSSFPPYPDVLFSFPYALSRHTKFCVECWKRIEMNLCCGENRREWEKSYTGNEPRQSYCVMIDLLALNIRSTTLRWFRFTAKNNGMKFCTTMILLSGKYLSSLAPRSVLSFCTERESEEQLCSFLVSVIRSAYFSPCLKSERDESCSDCWIFAKYDTSCHLLGLGLPSELA
jgi:hypothetical protein